jgi:GH25 family lysozyme M1 (1,4-beta-N-acetylmuramidase)
MITKSPVCYDTSHWKIVPDFAAVAPRPFLVITKATEGTGYTDDTFVRYFNDLKQDSIHRGAFHFFRRALDARAQAQHFCNVIRPVVNDNDVLVLDFEEGSETAAQLLAFLSYVRSQFPRNLIMNYSRKNIMDAIPMTQAQKDEMRKYPTWTAGYPSNPDLYPVVPSFYVPDQTRWGVVWLWQYAASGSVAGISGDVDCNWMHPDLYARINGGITPPPVEPGENMKGKVIKLTNIRQSNTQFSADMGDLLAGDLVEWTEEGTGPDGLVWIKLISATHNGAPVRCSDGNTVTGRYCWAANVEEVNAPPPVEEPPAFIVAHWVNGQTRKYLPE